MRIEKLDVDECVGDHKCPGPCINTAGSYKCNCTIPGYQPSSAGHYCQDFNECSVNNGGCDDICLNRRGTYECRCEHTGLRLGDDLHSCVDYDECLRYGEKLCRHGRCVNLDGSFRCDCENGFEPSSEATSCVDTDECQLGNGGCDDRCENQFGYFNCYCDADGYVLADDGLSCEDIDECFIQADECEDTCINIPGNYRCECQEVGVVVSADNISCTECNKTEYYSTTDGRCHLCPPHSVVSSRLDTQYALSPQDCECLPGFDGDLRYNIPCVDRDECRTGDIQCVHGCVNLPGSAQCTCPEGFTSEADNINCLDIDECGVSLGGCAHLCMNSPGSYWCECDGEGYIMLEDQHSCQDIDECEDPNYCSHECENVEGSVVCLCPTGFKLNTDMRSCIDIDECLLYNPPCDQICMNEIASYTCQCRHGFKLSWDKRTCIDVNECMEGESMCEEGCVNTVGSFHCQCKEKGYATSKDGFSCVDIDECADNANKSLCEQKCTNLPGSYRCECHAGYRKARNGKCVPCLRGYYRSLEDTVCKRCPKYSTTTGTATKSKGDCKCRSGYYGNLAYNVQCRDINECSNNNFRCSDICVNTEGSAYCSCQSGYTLGSDRKKCNDIDECSQSNACEQQCVNTIGSYTCGCDLKYFRIGTDANSCLDIDECEDDKFGCEHTCINTIGGAYCTCPTGFELQSDKKMCRDADECLTDNGGCDDVCLNTAGSYRCECQKSGFEKYLYDAKKCVDINECIRLAPCLGLCKNTYGSYRCQCRGSGLRLAADGKTCLDINECDSPDLCEHTCVNVRGSYRCECNPGHYSTGKGCQLCPIGTYNSKSSNKRSCSRCPTKAKTPSKGSTSSTDCACAPGFVSDPNKGDACFDINECAVKNGGCNHRCNNSPGSFSCTCRSSYTLQSDKKTCIIVSCPTLKPLLNGRIWPPACTSHVARRKLKKGTVCTFRCNRGYDQVGDRLRTCQADSKWTGTSTVCEAKYCDGLRAPRNGKIRPTLCAGEFVAFRQRCTYSCNPGYSLVGRTSTKCKANQSWSNPSTPQCQPDKSLKRNDV